MTKLPAARGDGCKAHDEERQDQEDENDPWDDVDSEDGVGVTELIVGAHDSKPFSTLVGNNVCMAVASLV